MQNTNSACRQHSISIRVSNVSKRITMKIHTSIEVGSRDINTLYSLLLIAGPILDSVNDPLLLAVFCCDLVH